MTSRSSLSRDDLCECLSIEPLDCLERDWYVDDALREKQRAALQSEWNSLDLTGADLPIPSLWERSKAMLTSKWFTFLFFVLLISVQTQSQTIWKKFPGNPIVTNSREIDWAYSASVMYDENIGMYKMWYSALLTSMPFLQVMYATSSDGVQWHQNLVNPVLESGTFGEFDYSGISDPCVIYNGGEYKMYYTGQNGNSWQTGLATSQDGIHWVKHPSNPVLGLGSGWEAVGHGSVEVSHQNGIYRMLYSGFDGSKHMIGLATSSDGIQWTRYSGNPVFRPSASGWDSFSVFASAHFVYNGQFYLSYVGKPQNGIGLATSPDAITWSRVRSTPVLNPGSFGTWESTILTGSMVVRDGSPQFWYTGLGSTYQIGFAYTDLAALTSIPPTGTTNRLSKLALGNYPNPSNPTTKIWFVLPVQDKVKLAVFNILGEQVATLVDEVQSEGYHEVEWLPESSPSGIYYYRILAGRKSVVRSMVLVR